MAGPDWLISRPIAHRGLHDAAVGRIENTATAALAAIAGGYAIECDVQISADGEAMVFHDDNLNRLTEAQGPVAALPASELRRIALRNTTDTIMTLGEYCDLIDGRATLIVEIKSRFNSDPRLADRVVKILKACRGPVAAMSFDPLPVTVVRHIAPEIFRGIVVERHYTHPEWHFLTPAQKRSLAWMLHAPSSRPQFIAYHVTDLPTVVPSLARILGLPVLTWTVRTDAQRQVAKRNADQMIFEGFRA